MKLVAIVIYLFVSLSANAQFFKPIPKVKTSEEGFLKAHASGVAKLDSSKFSFRPISNLVAYGQPGNILMSGLGIAYEKNQWNIEKQKWLSVYSVAGMVMAGVTLTKGQTVPVANYAILFGVSNNLIQIGPAMSADKKFFWVTTIAINFNN